MASGNIRVLVVDDDADLRAALSDYLLQMDVQVRAAADVVEAQRLIQTEKIPFDLVLTDLKIPGGTGMDVLRAAHTRSSETLVTIITGYGTMETAIEAIRFGAYNYITKPFSLNEIGVQVRNMIERVAISRENARLSLRLQELYKQVNDIQSKRAEYAQLYEGLKSQLRENSRKLDRLVMLCSRSSAKDPEVVEEMTADTTPSSGS
jgi:DNA-binding NtrC family response regulator